MIQLLGFVLTKKFSMKEFMHDCVTKARRMSALVLNNVKNVDNSF